MKEKKTRFKVLKKMLWAFFEFNKDMSKKDDFDVILDQEKLKKQEEKIESGRSPAILRQRTEACGS